MQNEYDWADLTAKVRAEEILMTLIVVYISGKKKKKSVVNVIGKAKVNCFNYEIWW